MSERRELKGALLPPSPFDAPTRVQIPTRAPVFCVIDKRRPLTAAKKCKFSRQPDANDLLDLRLLFVLEDLSGDVTL